MTVREKNASKYRITTLDWINDEHGSPKLICNDLQTSIISKIDDAGCFLNSISCISSYCARLVLENAKDTKVLS